MGCCHNNDQYNIIAKEYYDNISNANEVLGSYNTFVDAIINVQNTNSQKYPGTYIIKINKKQVFYQKKSTNFNIFLFCLKSIL